LKSPAIFRVMDNLIRANVSSLIMFINRCRWLISLHGRGKFMADHDPKDRALAVADQLRARAERGPITEAQRTLLDFSAKIFDGG